MRQRIRVTFWTEVDDETHVSQAVKAILTTMEAAVGLSLNSVDCEPVYSDVGYATNRALGDAAFSKANSGKEDMTS